MRFLVAQTAGSDVPAVNIAALEDAAVRAGTEKADLLVLPEYASGFDPAGVGSAQAQLLDGPYVTRMRELSRRHAVWIAAGVATCPDLVGAADGARPRNTIVVTDPAGTIAGTYDKVHLYDAFGARESDRLTAGDPAATPTVISIADVRVGIITCYDLRFPESARRVIDAGGEIVLVPAAWASGPGKLSHWETLARARAIENVAVVAAVGLAGQAVTGNSLVVAPDGEVRARLGDEPGFLAYSVAADEIRAARLRNPSLAARKYRVEPL
ncbi:carbon-nitrogen hydrolase family protein [Rarobacter faecitabidus]|uniref:Putative amidohydrolase n=1 Tax=Rarobacter faecitabidus TaxID=13243 RepID=A0A542ZU07_RARFA|nr:nitrilase-related carbon-nitrogen hydrolase [Rarobacter faecitabidus]TQL63843.1 putative amidohydrolase [Rarobacter faecitabidus]